MAIDLGSELQKMTIDGWASEIPTTGYLRVGMVQRGVRYRTCCWLQPLGCGMALVQPFNSLLMTVHV